MLHSVYNQKEVGHVLSSLPLIVSQFQKLRDNPLPMSFNRSSLAAQRGRGNWRGGSSHRAAWTPKAAPKVPSGPFGPEIDSIEIKALFIDEGSPEITSVEYVASYNWVACTKPIMLVPGESILRLLINTTEDIMLIFPGRLTTCLVSADRRSTAQAR